MSTFDTDLKAGRTIAEESPDAAGLLVAFMGKNAEEQAKRDESLRNMIERERDEWKERALAAEAEILAIERRVTTLIYGDGSLRR